MGMIVSCLSNVMYLSEKMVLWLTCVGLISCIMLMFIITLGMGIGLGYNYCFVDMRTKYKHVPGHYIYPGNARWPHKGLRDEGGQMLPDTTENPLDEALRQSVTGFQEETPSIKTLDENDYFDKPSRNNIYNNRQITNESEVQELVHKLGLIDNTTETEDLDDNEEVTTNNSVTEINITPETTLEITTVDTNTYPNFDDVDKSVEINDAIIDPAMLRPTLPDPYTDDATEAPVVDIDVDSPDQSGGKRVKKVVIPISGLDLISLLSKLKTENRNYSLQIVTT